MIDKPVVIVKQKTCYYPQIPPFRPSIAYPEYKGPISKVHNYVYEMVREGFFLAGYDKEHFGSKAWNPLKNLISEGDTVVLKPNLVMDRNQIPQNGTDCLYTQPSIVAAVTDYIIIALGGKGKIIIGDAPMQECKFDKLIESSGYLDLVSYYKKLLQKTDITIDLSDFRQLTSVVVKGVHYTAENEVKGTVIDLAQNSEFVDSSEYSYCNMRITNYDPEILKRHHNATRNEYYICDQILAADVIINMPKPKTHRKAGVTISLKNLVGINSRKEYLPHHTKGSCEEGGDEYENPSWLKRMYGRVLDKRNYLSQTKKAYGEARFLNYCNKMIRIPIRITQKDDYREGNWHGNDTISKTIVDLNKILFYADKNGIIQRKKQRRYLVVADMIISGEKEGPVAPSAKKTGIIAIGEDPVCFDEAIAELMGANRSYIHTLCRARNPKGNLMLTEADSIPYLVSNIPRWNHKHLDELRPNDLLYFKPTSGWTGAFKQIPDKEENSSILA